jgi:hypothetical protein
MMLNTKTLQLVLTCLQVMQNKVRLIQAQSQLLNDELINIKNQQPMKYYELVFVQNNPLYNDDDDDDDQQSVKENLSEPNSEETSNEDEVFQVQHNQTQNTLSKPIIIP